MSNRIRANQLVKVPGSRCGIKVGESATHFAVNLAANAFPEAREFPRGEVQPFDLVGWCDEQQAYGWMARELVKSELDEALGLFPGVVKVLFVVHDALEDDAKRMLDEDRAFRESAKLPVLNHVAVLGMSRVGDSENRAVYYSDTVPAGERRLKETYTEVMALLKQEAAE